MKVHGDIQQVSGCSERSLEIPRTGGEFRVSAFVLSGDEGENSGCRPEVEFVCLVVT